MALWRRGRAGRFTLVVLVIALAAALVSPATQADVAATLLLPLIVAVCADLGRAADRAAA